MSGGLRSGAPTGQQCQNNNLEVGQCFGCETVIANPVDIVAHLTGNRVSRFPMLSKRLMGLPTPGKTCPMVQSLLYLKPRKNGGGMKHAPKRMVSAVGQRVPAARSPKSQSRQRGALTIYPCQTCFPHAHCTVSVGLCLVSCCAQIGQGLVITYVIILPPTQDQSPVQVLCTLPARILGAC